MSFKVDTQTDFELGVLTSCAADQKVGSVVLSDAVLANVTGLKGWWQLDENTGIDTYDFTDNNNDGVLTGGAGWVAGKIGNAVSFDGTDDWVNLGTSATLEVQGAPFTVGGWFYFVSTVKYNCPMFTSTTLNVGGYALIINRGPGTDTDAIDLVKVAVVDQYVSYTFSADTWYHVMAVQQYSGGSPSQADFYVNGSYVNSFSNTSAYLSSSGHTRTLGAKMDHVTFKWMNGYLDDVRVYNRALSSSEISAIYNAGAGRYFPSTGTVASQVYNSGVAGRVWTQINRGTGIFDSIKKLTRVRVRASDTPFNKTDAWTSYWEVGVQGGANLTAFPYTLTNVVGQYLQWEVMLETTNTSVTPQLDDVTVGERFIIAVPESLSITDGAVQKKVYLFLDESLGVADTVAVVLIPPATYIIVLTSLVRGKTGPTPGESIEIEIASRIIEGQ